MKKIHVLLVFVLLLSGTLTTMAQKESKKKPKNVIFMIGDGMGVAQIYAGYTLNKGELNLEKFRCIGFSKTNSADNYITDSAAGATAFSIGEKTYNGAIGVDKDTVARETVLERAEKRGLSTGLVTACAITHATPAAFIAHQPHREMYEEIAADFLRTPIDIFVGGGYINFTKRADSLNLADTLTRRGYTVARTMQELKKAKAPIAGLLFDEHPPKMLEGRGDYLGEAAEKAIDVLSENEKGFFMMIEGSQIDWGGHENNADYIATEMVDFDNTLGRVLRWAKHNGETLVVITADHETGGFGLVGGNLKEGTLKGAFTTKGHTAVMVPVFAYGPGAEEFMGIYNNNEIHHKIVRLLRID